MQPAVEIRARVAAWLAQLSWTATAIVRYVQQLG
jgi:hypothetical protein